MSEVVNRRKMIEAANAFARAPVFRPNDLENLFAAIETVLTDMTSHEVKVGFEIGKRLPGVVMPK